MLLKKEFEIIAVSQAFDSGAYFMFLITIVPIYASITEVTVADYR